MLVLWTMTMYQLHDSWDGNMWSMPDEYGWASHVQWAVNLSSELLVHDDENREIVERYRTPHDAVDSDGHGYSEDHQTHHDTVSRIVRGHWQFEPLRVALVLSSLLVLSWLARRSFLYFRQTWMLFMATVNAIWLSLLAQGVGTMIRVYVCLFMQSTYSISTLLISFFAVLLELVSVYELYNIRKATLFMGSKMKGHEQETLRRVYIDQMGMSGQEADMKAAEATLGGKVILDALLELVLRTDDSISAEKRGEMYDRAQVLRRRRSTWRPSSKQK